LTDLPRVPAPWSLEGRAHIVFFHPPPEFVAFQSMLPGWLADTHAGGLASLMLIDYRRSDVGPYREVLFIPGRFRVAGRRLYSITRIYVSTPASVMNGRANWAIPKELADIAFEPLADGTERVTASLPDGRRFLRFEARPGGPRFPVSTRLLHFPLVQQQDHGHLLQTRPGGHGWGRLARVRHLSGDGLHFPDLSPLKPLLAVQVEPLHVQFPAAEPLAGVR
jgi:hypothetical protein